MSKVTQSRGIFGSLLSKIADPLMEIAAPLAKNILAQLGIAAPASAINADIQKKMYGFGTITLVTSNEEISDKIQIVQALEDYNISFKVITNQLKIKPKNKKEYFQGCYQVHQELVSQEICSQEKDILTVLS